MSDLLERIGEIEARARVLEERLAEPQVASVPGEYAKVAKQLGGLRPIVEAGRRYRQMVSEIESSRDLLSESDPELREMARADVDRLTHEREALEAKIRELLLPKDPNDEKDVILENPAPVPAARKPRFSPRSSSACTAAMPSRGAGKSSRSRWPRLAQGGSRKRSPALAASASSAASSSSAVSTASLRVPATESAGRIHTSTVTVAGAARSRRGGCADRSRRICGSTSFALPGREAESVNTTDSAVRITHLPTGLVVQCQDEKSQHKNKARALKILRARLVEAEQEKKALERASDRRAQVGTGDRNERIRTYNFPQSRVTDHRAGVTLHRLESILEGELDELLDALRVHFDRESAREETR